MTRKTYDTKLALLEQSQFHITEKVNEIHKVIVGSNGTRGLRDEMSELRGGIKYTQIVFGVLMSIITIIVFLV